MRHSFRSPSVAHDRGSTLVEFGLVSLALVMLFLGVVEMGRMVLVYNSVSNAAAEGTRYAVVHGRAQTSPSAVVTRVKTFLASAPVRINGTTTAVNACYDDVGATTCTGTACAARANGPNSSNAPIGSQVTVCVKYTYDPFIASLSSLLAVNLGSQSQGLVLY